MNVNALVDYTIEATPKDIDAFAAAMPDYLPPAKVFVPWLASESDDDRVAACGRLRALGYEPVPHLPARRIKSMDHLERLLAGLQETAAVEGVLLIAGDLDQPAGPFADSLSVIKTGLLATNAIRYVAIAGHPDGHPQVPEGVMRQALRDKAEALADCGHHVEIVTQFSFDADGVANWCERLSNDGLDIPLRIGVAGPAGIRMLLRYAARCGVSASASVVGKYGLSLARLLGSAGPDRFIEDLERKLDRAAFQSLRLHIFPFGGFVKTAGWIVQTSQVPDTAAA